VRWRAKVSDVPHSPRASARSNKTSLAFKLGETLRLARERIVDARMLKDMSLGNEDGSVNVLETYSLGSLI